MNKNDWYNWRINFISEDGRKYAVPLLVLWPTYQAMRRKNLTIDEAVTIASFGAWAAHTAMPEGLHPHYDNDSAVHNIRVFLTGLGTQSVPWTEKDDLVMNFTYDLLCKKLITREDAAVIAGNMIKQMPLDQELYRKRLDYWVKTHKLEPIGQTKRRSRK